MKNYLRFCNENIDLDPFGEEDWNEFQEGDYVTLIKLPENEKSWVHRSKTKVFIIQASGKKFNKGKDHYEVVLPKDDMPKGLENMKYHAFIEADCLRLATQEEIKQEYGVKEAIRWYKNGKLEPFTQPEKDLILVQIVAFNQLYYIAHYDDNFKNKKNIFNGKPHTVANVDIYCENANGNLQLIIPEKVDSGRVQYWIENRWVETTISKLPVDLKERIINL